MLTNLKLQYEWNARTQITMWFDNSEEEASLLRDYGNDHLDFDYTLVAILSLRL